MTFALSRRTLRNKNTKGIGIVIGFGIDIRLEIFQGNDICIGHYLLALETNLIWHLRFN